MTTAITTRASKAAPISFEEMDTNLINLRNTLDSNIGSVAVQIAALQAGQQYAAIGFTTKALMDAALNYAANTIAIVTNDATSTNNTYWIKLGASGAGSWQKSAMPPPLPFYDVRNYASFSAAVSAIGSTPSILICAGALPVAASMSVPSTCCLWPVPGCVLSPASGQTLTIGKIMPVPWTCFGGAGTVAFSPGAAPFFYPEMWGAASDGTTVSRTACAAAIATGFDVQFLSGTYYMGAIAPAGTYNTDQLFLISGKAHQNIRGSNTVISVNLTNSSGTIAGFNIINSRNIFIDQVRVVNTGTVPAGGAFGLAAIALTGVDEVHSIHVTNFRAEKCLAGVLAVTSAGKCFNLSFDQCYIKDGEYGFNFQNSGDQVSIKNTVCDGLLRAYFPFGVRKHDIDLRILNNQATSATCNIKCYNTPIRDIRLRVWYESGLASAVVALEQQPDVSGTGKHEDIDLYIYDNDTNTTPALVLRSYTQAGVLEATSAGQWNRITVDGHLGTGGGTNCKIDVQTKSTAWATVTLSPGILAQLQATAGYIYLPGVILRQPECDIITTKHNPTVSTVSYPVKNAEGMAVMHKVRLFAIADITGVAAAVEYYGEHLLVGYVSGGAYSAQTTYTLITERNRNGTGAFVHDQSGGNLVLYMSGANYNNANGYQIWKIERVSNLLR